MHIIIYYDKYYADSNKVFDHICIVLMVHMVGGRVHSISHMNAGASILNQLSTSIVTGFNASITGEEI